MWNDFLPGIASIGIAACVFLYSWISDMRRMQRLDTLEPPQFEPLFSVDSANLEQLSTPEEVGP